MTTPRVKRIITELELYEISAVDKPAVEGATAKIIKGANMSIEKLQAELDKANALIKSLTAKPVYKALDGKEYTDQDNDDLVAMAKARDNEITKRKELEQEIAISKQVAELSALPGDEEVLSAVVKSLNAIADTAVRNKAFDLLKAKSVKIAETFKETGETAAEDNSDLNARVDAELDRIAKANNITRAKARIEFIKSRSELAKAYNQANQPKGI